MAKQKKDLTGGDHSFSNWFRIMWKNRYVQIFAFALIILLIQIFNLGWCITQLADAYFRGFFEFLFLLIAMLLPTAICAIVAFKGFYQFWNDLKKGTRR